MSKITGMIKGIKISTLMAIIIGGVLIGRILLSVTERITAVVGAGIATPGGGMDTYLYIGAVTFLVLVTLFGGWHILKDKPFASKVVAYTVAVVILLSSVVWLNFGYIDGDAFNPSTGEPNYMYDPTTGKIDKNHKPVDCRPPSVSHKGYDYSRFEGCYSAKTQAKLMPITFEVARKVQPDTWASLVYEWIDEFFKEEEAETVWSQGPPPKPAPAPEPTHPDGAFTLIGVPSCSTGIWSLRVNTYPDWKVKPAWNVGALEVEALHNGKWVKITEQLTIGDYIAVRYCTKVEAYAGDAMPLVWTKI